MDIEPAATKNITLGFTAPTEAGNPVTPNTANSTLCLNYFSIKSVADPIRNVSVKVNPIILQITTEAPQGKHTVLLEGTEITTGEKFSQTAELLISTNRKLSLTLLDSPEFIKAGETIKSTFVLKNDGNVSENLILESKNAIVDENTSLILAPGKSKKISISKITPSNLR